MQVTETKNSITLSGSDLLEIQVNLDKYLSSGWKLVGITPFTAYGCLSYLAVLAKHGAA